MTLSYNFLVFFFILNFQLIFININSATISPKKNFCIQHQVKQFSTDEIKYGDSIFKSTIRTPVIYREGWELSYPIIKYNSDEKIHLGFDDLSTDVKDYSYTLIHCNANWESSDLEPMDYLEGFEENPISDYEVSFNTLVLYYHYKLTIPNDEVQFKLSGNYILKVFEDYDIENVVLTRRLSVVEPLVEIIADVKRPAVSEYIDTGQEIDFVIDQREFTISDPNDIQIVISQNNRLDNRITNLKPSQVTNDKLEYNYEIENIFKAGNEFRHVDLKNRKFKEMETESISFDSVYHFHLRPDEKRLFNYSYEEDLNGNYLVKLESSEQSYIDADYFYSHFYLPFSAPIDHGRIFVFGSFSDWQVHKKEDYPDCTNEMIYNEKTLAYEANILLKQGYYNYEYVYVKNGSSQIDNSYIEGAHHSTENNYLIYVYYQTIGMRYQKLIGIKIANSIKR